MGALALVVPSLGCAGHRTPDATRPLEMLVSADPETLDPRFATDAVGLRVTRLVHAGLVRLDPDTLAPVPYVAKGWRWQDPLTLEVTLRDDVRFHPSGVPVRAHDVAETLRAFASPRVASRHARVVETIDAVEEHGDRVVVIHLGRPHATLLTDLELPVLRADQAWGPPSPEGRLDGLGPFAVARVTRGEVDLVPAQGAALPRPSHAVTVRVVHDENARALRLEAGDADVALNLVSPTLLPALAAQSGLAVTSRPGANLTYIVVQEQRPGLGDRRVRQAISLGIDRALLCATLFDGRAQPASGLIAQSHWAHAEAAPLPFDPVRGRSLLAEAGPGPWRFTLLTSTDRLRVDVAHVIGQELEAEGAAVQVVSLELGTMIARLNAGEFDLAVLQLPEMTEPNVLRHFLHGDFVPPTGANRGRVHDREIDALLDEGDAVVGEVARRAIYARLEGREREEMHLVPLFYEDQVVVTSERARGFRPSAEGRWLGLAGF